MRNFIHSFNYSRYFNYTFKMFTNTELVTVVIATILAAIYYFFAKTARIKKFLDNFPNPPTKFLIGNVYDFKTPAEFFYKLHEYTKKYGSMIHLRTGPIGHVLVSSDEDFLQFLLSHNKLLKKRKNLKFLEPWIGKGLVTADGSKWKLHRKLITPAFHFKILEQFVDIFEEDGNTLVEKLGKVSEKQSVDIYPYISKCTLEAICETAMGTKIDVQNNETSEYFNGVKEMCRLFAVRTTSLFLANDLLFRLSKDYLKQTKALEYLHGYTNNVIAVKRKNQEGKFSDEKEIDELGRKRKKAFLDLVLEAQIDGKPAFSDKEIRDEVATFMFGGHDTTATASSFILYCIANNKDLQDKIVEEQETLFGDNKNPKVTYNELQEMKYLENVIKEGLRLYSPVPLYGRLIDQDVEYNGMIIPKNTPVIIFSHGVHMNPKHYPNPEKFDPSRFENIENKHPFAFIPFSAGPRNCIGQKFAMLELKSLVSKIVRNFELTPAFPKHDLQLTAETVLKSINGVKIGLKARSVE